jgi:hypothetical protein
VLALVSYLNADLPPLLPIQAPLRARWIRHPYLLLPVCLRVLEREGVTARVLTLQVFTLAGIQVARYTKVVLLDHLLLVQKLWRGIMSLPFLYR